MSSFFAKLEDRATLVIAGPDAKAFLQGQTTCDIGSLSDRRSLPGAYCTPQGRMICDFRLVEQSPEQILMLLPADVVDAALTAFGKYIVFSRATIGDESARWCQFAAWGADALARIGAPGEDTGTCWIEGDILWTITAADTAEACAPLAAAERLAARLAEGLRATDSADYRRHEIELGVGHVRGPTVEMFLPQMLNYQLMGRISFTKGCYTGQEVVARMHYRGKLKRAMLIASTTNAPAAPGDPLYAADSQQPVGNVVSAEPAGDGQLKLLVVIALDARQKTVTLGDDGPTLSFPPMPYSVEAGESG